MSIREKMKKIKKEINKNFKDEEIDRNLTLQKLEISLSYHNNSLKYYLDKINREKELKSLDNYDDNIFKEILKVLKEFNLTLNQHYNEEQKELLSEIEILKKEKELFEKINTEVLSENENIYSNINNILIIESANRTSSNLILVNSLFRENLLEKNKEDIINILYEIKYDLNEQIEELQVSIENNKKYLNEISLIIHGLKYEIKEHLKNLIVILEERQTDEYSLEYDMKLLNLHEQTYKFEFGEIQKIKIKNNSSIIPENKNISKFLKLLKNLKSVLINNFKSFKDYILSN